MHTQGFPGGSDGKEPTCSAGDLGSVPGLGRSPERGHGNPLQSPFLENPRDRGAWQATVHRITKESNVTLVTKHTNIQSCKVSFVKSILQVIKLRMNVVK